MKDKKKIKRVAQKIVDLEKLCLTDKNNLNKYLKRMQQLTENLSFEELLAVDEYILSNNLLKR